MITPGFKHIANRLLVWILGLCLLIFAGFAWMLYQQTSLLIKQQAQSRAELAVDSTVHRIETLLAHARRSVRTARSSLQTSTASAKQLEELLRTLVEDKPEVYGMALALEPGTLSGDTGFAPYVYRSAGQLHTLDLASGNYNYRQQAWYSDPFNRGRSMWSEPYYDRGGGNIAMVTYSSPIFSGEDNNGGAESPLGVITADISLQTLSEMIDPELLGNDGYAYILSREGRIITHQRPELRMTQVQQLAAWNSADPAWRNVIETMSLHHSGHTILPCEPGASAYCWLSYEPLKDSNWSILVLIPLAGIEKELLSLGQVMLLLGGAAMLLLGVVVLWLSRRVSRPIGRLALHTELIASGDLDSPVPGTELEDEVGTLANTLSTMQARLKQHITELTAETARRERLESELTIAASIQAQLLPDGGHSQIRFHNLQLTAMVQAARQIGGDFYYYQTLKSGQLLFCIADVSDKGIPAALFMAQCITQIRSLALATDSPSSLLCALNEQLLVNNDNCMFVTAIVGILDTDGCCHLASAGHSAPLLRLDGVSPLELTTGPALGLLEQVAYPEISVQLAPGSTLLCYTDGADEASDVNGEQFGVERITEILEALGREDGARLLDKLMGRILEYQQRQIFDDITLLAIHRPTAP